jgi:hypothetical protein
VRGGFVTVQSAAGADRVRLIHDLLGTGALFINNSAGNAVVQIGPTNSRPTAGGLSIADGAVSNKIDLFVDGNGMGTVAADVKNFKTVNPADPSTEIWYASLEGPEAAAYVRGTATLVNGEAVIELPEHFRSIASAQGVTVQLTPNSADSLGLAVVEKGPERIVVRELLRGRGTYAFDYQVTAVRRGFENYRVIRPVPAPLPTPVEP